MTKQERLFKERVGRLRTQGVSKTEARRQVLSKKLRRRMSAAQEARENALDERDVKSILDCARRAYRSNLEA